MTLSNIVKKYHKIDTGGTEHHLDISYEYASEYLYEELMLTRKKNTKWEY